jgi:ribonuclease HI
VHIVNTDTKEVLQQISEAIGEGTNTYAEYTAFTRGVQAAIQLCDQHGVTKVILLADSNLVVSQVGGSWKASGDTKVYVQEAKKWVELLRRKAEVVIDHIPREYNTDADALSTQATDKAVEQSVETKYPFLTK